MDYGPDIEMGGNKEIYLTFYTRSIDIEDCIDSEDYHFNSNTGSDQDGFLAKILNNTVSKRFDCLDFDWGSEGPERSEFSESPVPSIQLFPNPSDGNFMLQPELQSAISESATVEVLNLMGQIVHKKEIPVIEGKLATQILINQLLPKGVYVLRLTMSNCSYVEELICQ